MTLSSRNCRSSISCTPVSGVGTGLDAAPSWVCPAVALGSADGDRAVLLEHPQVLQDARDTPVRCQLAWRHNRPGATVNRAACQSSEVAKQRRTKHNGTHRTLRATCALCCRKLKQCASVMALLQLFTGGERAVTMWVRTCDHPRLSHRRFARFLDTVRPPARVARGQCVAPLAQRLSTTACCSTLAERTIWSMRSAHRSARVADMM